MMAGRRTLQWQQHDMDSLLLDEHAVQLFVLYSLGRGKTHQMQGDGMCWGGWGVEVEVCGTGAWCLHG